MLDFFYRNVMHLAKLNEVMFNYGPEIFTSSVSVNTIKGLFLPG